MATAEIRRWPGSEPRPPSAWHPVSLTAAVTRHGPPALGFLLRKIKRKCSNDPKVWMGRFFSVSAVDPGSGFVLHPPSRNYGLYFISSEAPP